MLLKDNPLKRKDYRLFDVGRISAVKRFLPFGLLLEITG